MKRIIRAALLAACTAALVLLSGCLPAGGLAYVTACTVEQSLDPYNSSETIRLEYTRYGEGYEITGYEGFAIHMVLPDSYRGKPVLRIGDRAFSSAHGLQSVIVPASVTEIGEEAFSGCPDLKTVEIQGSTHIGAGAFEECYDLSSVSLGQALTLGPRAFKHTDLRKITLPDTLTEIGASAFESTDLKQINFPDSLLSIGSRAFYLCELSSVELGSGPVVVHDHAFQYCGDLERVELGGAVHLGMEALYGLQIDELTLPDTLVSLGEDAISYAGVSTLNIGSGLAVFDESNFDGFSKLKTISLSPDNKALKLEDGVLFSADGSRLLLYPAMSRRSLYVVPDGVTEIGRGAFYFAEKLTSLTLPEGLKTIGRNAFFGSGITSLAIPEGTVRLEVQAVACCHNLTEVSLPDSLSVIEDYAFNLCSSLTAITLPEGLTELGDNCFSGCPITSFAIGPDLRSMGNNPFAGAPVYEFTVSEENTCFRVIDTALCTADGTVLVAYPRYSPAEEYTVPESIERISDSAFMFSDNLCTVTLPAGLCSLGSRAFYSCERLESVHMPAGLSSVGEYCFGLCAALREVTLSPALTRLPDSLFFGCAALEAITLPEGITEIGKNVFNGCAALEEITIPDSVTLIGILAFDGCTATVRAPHPAEYYDYYVSEETWEVIG